MDRDFPWFTQESRNIRLGLATDGFNPFGNMSNFYSIWLVILMPFNLPLWRYMKENFHMMSLLIPRPNAPRSDFDIYIYMQPLVDELKELWNIGVQRYDVSSGKNFQMHVAILWSIHDFPTYGTVFRLMTK